MKRSHPTIPKEDGVPKGTTGLRNWDHVVQRMTKAQHYWVCTVDGNGRPHATPVDALWLDDTLYCGGSTGTRRHRNLTATANVVVHLEDAMDVVILHGTARELSSPPSRSVSPRRRRWPSARADCQESVADSTREAENRRTRAYWQGAAQRESCASK